MIGRAFVSGARSRLDFPDILGATFWAALAVAVVLPLISCLRLVGLLRTRGQGDRSLTWTEIGWTAVPIGLLALLVLHSLGGMVGG